MAETKSACGDDEVKNPPARLPFRFLHFQVSGDINNSARTTTVQRADVAAIWAVYCSGYVRQTKINDHLPGIIHPAILVISFFLAAYIIYRLSLYAQAQYGEAFKAVFDDNERKMDVSFVVKTVADVGVDSSILNLDRRQQYVIAWRYLHNYRVRCTRPECVKRDPMSPEAPGARGLLLVICQGAPVNGAPAAGPTTSWAGSRNRPTRRK